MVDVAAGSPENLHDSDQGLHRYLCPERGRGVGGILNPGVVDGRL